MFLKQENDIDYILLNFEKNQENNLGKLDLCIFFTI